MQEDSLISAMSEAKPEAERSVRRYAVFGQPIAH